MNKPQKVVVVTGAPQGIGAEGVKPLRKLDYRIVATSRSIKLPDDENILSVAGAIGDRTNAQRVILERSCTSTAGKVLAAERRHHLGGRK